MVDRREGTRSGKRRIIHWSPDGKTSRRFEKEATPRRWTSLVVVLAALAVLVATAGIGLRHYLELRARTDSALNGLGAERGSLDEPIFVSRERVERLRAAVRSEISDIRKVTDDHPILIQRLVRIETIFDEGNRLLAAVSYPQSLSKFEEVLGMVEEMKNLIGEKEIATDVYERFLVLIEQFEGLRIHAPYEYEKAIAFGTDGTFRLEAGEFTSATSEFNRAVDALAEFEQRVHLYLAERELSGKIALSAGRKEEAETIFNEILAAQPDNELAKRSLERAKNIDIFVPLIQRAKDLEKDGELEEALEAYTKAFELDARSARAQQGKARVARRIEKESFDTFVSTGTEVEEAGEWDLAIENYEEAVKAFPDEEDFQEALKRAQVEGLLAKVSAGLDLAFNFEEEYEWSKARDQFNAVLNLDRDDEEALDGLLRTGNMIRVLIRYDNLLEESRELAQRGEFQKAIADFNQAMAMKPSYLPLDASAQQLQKMLREQTTPVIVEFISDGKTFVSVSGYEIIGQFESHRRKFLPGNYRILGRRKGYRNVVLEVRVRSGKQLPPIKVICYQRS